MQTITRKPYKTDLTDNEWATLEPILQRALYSNRTKTRAHPKRHPRAKSQTPSSMSSQQTASGNNSPTVCPRERPSTTTFGVGNKAWCSCADTRRADKQGVGAGGQADAQACCGGRSACAVHGKEGVRGHDGGEQVEGRKRHIVVGLRGGVLGVWVLCADVSGAREARVVLERVLRWYLLAQMVIADGAHDKAGLLEWLLGEFCVALDCVFCEGEGFVVLARRWLMERSFARSLMKNQVPTLTMEV
jgi:transposase